MGYISSFSAIRLFLVLSFVTRMLIALYGINSGDFCITEVLGAIIVGGVNDLLTASFILPGLMLLRGITNTVFSRKLQVYIYYLGAAIGVCIITSIMFAELVFWDEFSTRFNFIAVDYLVYTHEIIGTVAESLPVFKIVAGLAVLNSAIIWYIISRADFLSIPKESHLFKFTSFVATFIIATLTYKYYDSDRIHFSDNRFAIELGKNGPYELISAYYNNTLSYDKFYTQVEDRVALSTVRKLLADDNSQFLSDYGISRIIKADGEAHKYNIVFITVESLSADFMGKFGNKGNITPYLDKLADESLLFTNLYAAGTRTVRGLEALTLSVPPTPGSSIIRRPENEGLFTIGSVLKANNYDLNFLYGGYSYFDNLENYFSNNGYKITDRTNLAGSEITHANIWGVADEDILIKSLEVADESYKAGKPFFSLIMTTSNHRPYTYPKNRIDIPSGDGRSGGVKYTDYAIGKFLEAAKTKPWFSNTIFVIVADHCAGSAGKTHLPIAKYHIPLIIYAPAIIKPGIVEKLASQIDVAPTVLGILNLQYKSKFFGQDLLRTSPNRAFIGTYQLLGYLKDDTLIILSPGRKVSSYKIQGDQQILTDNNPALVEEAISYYQEAYRLFIAGDMKEFIAMNKQDNSSSVTAIGAL